MNPCAAARSNRRLAAVLVFTMILVLVPALSFDVSANAAAVISDGAVNGTVHSPVTPVDFDIVLTDNYFISSLSGNADSWFTNMPAGLSANIATPLTTTASAITITVSGTPAAESAAAIEVTIPPSVLTISSPITVTANPNAKWNITVSTMAPAPTNLRWNGITALWNSVPGAAGYTVELYRGSVFVADTAINNPLSTFAYTSVFIDNIKQMPGEYTFRVRANYENGSSEWTVSPTIDTTGWSTLPSPATLWWDGSAALWETVPGHTGNYFIELWKEGASSWTTWFHSTSPSIQENSGTFSVDLSRWMTEPSANYTFRVLSLSNSANYVDSDWAVSPIYRMPLSAPANVRWGLQSAGQSPAWDAPANIPAGLTLRGYGVEVFRDGATIAANTNVTNLIWTATAITEGFQTIPGVYTFRVRATYTDGSSSEWVTSPAIDTGSWTKAAVPADAQWSAANAGTAAWTPVPDYTGNYRIQVRKNGEILPTLLNNVSGGTSAAARSTSLRQYIDEDGGYEFRIMALGGVDGLLSGDYSGWSDVYTYAAPAAKFSAPANVRWDGTITRWDAVEGDGFLFSYEFEVWREDASGNRTRQASKGGRTTHFLLDNFH